MYAIKKGDIIMSDIYIYNSEVCFLCDAGARKYFFRTGLDNEVEYDFPFETYLKEHFSCVDLFTLIEDEKQEIIQDYKDYLFEQWFEHEVEQIVLYDQDE